MARIMLGAQFYNKIWKSNVCIIVRGTRDHMYQTVLDIVVSGVMFKLKLCYWTFTIWFVVNVFLRLHFHNILHERFSLWNVLVMLPFIHKSMRAISFTLEGSVHFELHFDDWNHSFSPDSFDRRPCKNSAQSDFGHCLIYTRAILELRILGQKMNV